jgi:hypothetical protein
MIKNKTIMMVIVLLALAVSTITVITPLGRAQASLPGQIGQGYDDGRAQARSDFAQGIRHAVCPQGSDFAYCQSWVFGYNRAWDGLDTANQP